MSSELMKCLSLISCDKTFTVCCLNDAKLTDITAGCWSASLTYGVCGKHRNHRSAEIVMFVFGLLVMYQVSRLVCRPCLVVQ